MWDPKTIGCCCYIRLRDLTRPRLTGAFNESITIAIEDNKKEKGTKKKKKKKEGKSRKKGAIVVYVTELLIRLDIPLSTLTSWKKLMAPMIFHFLLFFCGTPVVAHYFPFFYFFVFFFLFWNPGLFLPVPGTR